MPELGLTGEWLFFFFNSAEKVLTAVGDCMEIALAV